MQVEMQIDSFLLIVAAAALREAHQATAASIRNNLPTLLRGT